MLIQQGWPIGPHRPEQVIRSQEAGTLRNVMRVLADDIARGVVEEWQRRKAVPVPPATNARDMLIQRLTQESESQLDMVQTGTFPEQQVLVLRLQRLERTLEKLAARIRSMPTETEVGSDSSKDGSKYQNVDSLLKYVDGSGAEGGVKLVIMNFND